MVKNKMSDLNNHLFEQLERLNDDELSNEQLEEEIKRSDAIGKVASNIISNANLSLSAERFKAEYGVKNSSVPSMLDSGE